MTSSTSWRNCAGTAVSAARLTGHRLDIVGAIEPSRRFVCSAPSSATVGTSEYLEAQVHQSSVKEAMLELEERWQVALRDVECLQAALKLKQRDAPVIAQLLYVSVFLFSTFSLSLSLSLSYSPFLSGRLLVGFPGLSLSFSLSLTLSLCLWLISYSQRSWHELSIMKGAAHK
jgi:hypothetical protein